MRKDMVDQVPGHKNLRIRVHQDNFVSKMTESFRNNQLQHHVACSILGFMNIDFIAATSYGQKSEVRIQKNGKHKLLAGY